MTERRADQLPSALAAQARANLPGRADDGVRVAVAPGRVNLIGEHTDYNDGFVLPIAIGRYVAVAAAPRIDRTLRVHSVDLGQTREQSLDALSPVTTPAWSDYIAGVAWALESEGFILSGADVAVRGDIPFGAGLSSSAALEVAAAVALLAIRSAANAAAPDAITLARLAQRAENAYVGVQCGIMDQVACAAAQEGSAILLDCRSLAIEPVPIPPDAAVVIMDTTVRRVLAGSQYNERRASCERVVQALRIMDAGVRALRDVDESMLVRAHHRLSETDAARALHVVREIRRPLRMRDALARGDLAEAGRLMDESHESLRVLYEVSCAELDAICAAARQAPGCLGARMTGAGFGGCAIALVRSLEVDRFVTEAASRYEAATGLRGSFFSTQPVGGVRSV